jgi:hypothetical protein
MPLASSSKAIPGVNGDRHSADDNEDKEKNDEKTKPQTQLFADNRKNEIRWHKGGKNFFGAVPETEALDPAATPAIRACILLQAGGEFVVTPGAGKRATGCGVPRVGEIENRAHSA